MKRGLQDLIIIEREFLTASNYNLNYYRYYCYHHHYCSSDISSRILLGITII